MQTIRYIAAILILCPILGCSREVVIPQKPIEPNKYRNLVIVAAALAAVTPANSTPVDPDNPPEPNNPVRRHTDCPDCNYKGWLGDGQPRADCPACDFNNDGNNEDPMSVFGEIIKSLNAQYAAEAVAEQKLETEKNKSEFTEEELRLSKPKTQLEWVKDTQEAIKKSAGTKPILVVLTATELSPAWHDKEVVEYINENYIPLCADLMSITVENAWASMAPKDDSVVKNGMFYSFKNDVFTVLNSNGEFTTEAAKTYIDVPISSKKLLELLKNTSR